MRNLYSPEEFFYLTLAMLAVVLAVLNLADELVRLTR